MRKLSKILALVLVLMMAFAVVSAFSFTSSAANIPAGTVLYLVPNANWNQDNARFAAYFFGTGNTWVSMTKVPGETNLYQVTVPSGSWTNVIFCRMNPNATANNWNNKWNQTGDLVYNGSSNCYTINAGSWDQGTWSTYGSSCTHANVGAAATCTEAQVCLDCGDPVVSALGHTYNSAHLCTRCNGQATFTVAGSGAHLGTEWDTGNVANDMTYADGVYTKVYTNVAAGSYLLKVARDHDWGTAYPSADKAYTVSTAGSTVTVTLKGTAVTVTVEAPHVHSWSDATCTEASKCSCGATNGEALGHTWVDATYLAPKTCSVCNATEGEARAIPGAGTEEDPYVIDSLETLVAFRDSVNAGETKYNAEGVYVALGADIDMSSVDWSVNIGDDCNATFDGIFDGKNHKLSNLNAKETAKKADGYVCGGLFGAIYGNAVIKNLTIENVSIDAGEFTGNNVAAVVGFVYAGKGSIENVTVCGKIEINAPGVYGVGAIVGYSYYGSNLTVKDCKVVGNEGSYINAVSGAGAIAGYAYGIHVVNAEVSGLTIEGAGLLGGLVGIAVNNSTDVNGAHVANVTLNATKDVWVNGTGIAVGTLSSNSIKIEGVTFENVTGADTLLGSAYAEKPETVVPGFVAKIGDIYYTDIQEALNVGGEVVLLTNVELNAALTVNGTVVIDLAGFTLSYDSTVMGEAMITNKGNLTINDSVGTGVINYNYTGANDASYGKGNYTISNAGTLTVNGGKITIANLRSHAKYPIDNNSTTGDAILVINGGHLYNYNTSAIRMFCNSTTNKNSVTINGGVVEGYCAVWVQNPGNKTVNADLTITGGEIRTTAAAWVNGTANLNEVSSALYFTIAANGGAWSEASFVAITGGTFNENVYLADSAPANISIGEGATFNGYVELPHTHSWSDATCTEPSKCSCGETQGEALGHTPGAAATCTTAQTCTVCGAELVAKLGHVDANLDIDCDREGCTGKVAPAADTVLSNFTANNLGSKLSTSGSYYVVGTIVEVLDARNGIFLIDDGTGETFYFRLPKNAEGVSHASWTVKLLLGDKVQLYGKINKYTVSTAPNGQYWPAMQSPVVTVLEQHPHVFGEPTCTEPGYCECGQDGPVALGHKDTDANGLCDVCNWLMKASVEEIKIPLTSIAGTDALGSSTALWNGTIGSVLATKGTGSTFCAVATYDHMRLYNNNDLTVSVSGNNEIISLIFTATSSSYVDELEAYLKSAGYEYTVDGLTATIAIDSLASVKIVNTSGKTPRIASVQIIYVPHEHNYKAVVTAPTCTAAGYTTYTCACGDTKTGDEVAALGHTYENCACTVCGAVLPTLGQTDTFDFTTADGLNAALASGKLGYTGTFRNNGDSHQFAADSSIQFVVPANTTVTLTGHSTGYGVFTVYVNGVKHDMAGALVFTVTEESKVVIVPDETATYSKAYLKGIALAEYVDRTITSDTTINFGSEGNYKDSLVDFSGIQIGDNGGNNSQVKNGSFDLLLKAGSKVVIHGYPGYTSYKLNDGEEITSEYYTYLALEDTVLTVTPVSGNNYFYSIEVTLHTGVAFVEATDSTCKVAGHEAYYSCECHGELTEKVARELAAHTEEVLAAVAPTCTATGLTEGKKCSVCDEVLVAQEEVAALGHNYEAVVTDPTCTGAGYTTYTCACGDTYTGDEVAALEHEYVDGVCTVCGKEDTNYVPPHEHNFVEGKCECGETDPDYVEPVEPQEEPNFFQKILAWIVELFKQFIALFKKN